MLKPGTVAARNSCAYSSWRSPEKGGVERMFTLQLLFPLALLLSYWMAGQLERLTQSPVKNRRQASSK